MSKRHFLGYAGRYIRRLPISQRRILHVTEQEVVYQYKDTQQSKETRMKIVQEACCTPAELLPCSRNMSWIGTSTPCAISAC
jgi:hypothetical protein